MNEAKRPSSHIKLNSHPNKLMAAAPIVWGAPTPKERGPVIGTLNDASRRNAIGAHAGSYSLYRALAVASGTLDPLHRPDLTDTAPAAHIGPAAQWRETNKIVSLDPYGHLVSEVFAEELKAGWDIRPTIAVTKAQLNMPEIRDAIKAGRLKPDGEVLTQDGDARVTKAAIEPVWYLPGIAERFGVTEGALRRCLFEQSGGMFTELVTRNDLKIFLPPIGGITIYCFGNLGAISDPKGKVACRVHDECNGSDVFGSDICTCRPYLAHGIEVCIETAQQGGAGVIVYNRKEGRALGEVTKFLVYNARKRQLHWLGISRIDRFVSMSNMKHESIVRQGIEIADQVAIPKELIPDDASVEMAAKRAAGYFSETPIAPEELTRAVGRGLHD
jgi:GTP cyclohydrolase II